MFDLNSISWTILVWNVYWLDKLCKKYVSFAFIIRHRQVNMQKFFIIINTVWLSEFHTVCAAVVSVLILGLCSYNSRQKKETEMCQIHGFEYKHGQ